MQTQNLLTLSSLRPTVLLHLKSIFLAYKLIRCECNHNCIVALAATFSYCRCLTRRCISVSWPGLEKNRFHKILLREKFMMMSQFIMHVRTFVTVPSFKDRTWTACAFRTMTQCCNYKIERWEEAISKLIYRFFP